MNNKIKQELINRRDNLQAKAKEILDAIDTAKVGYNQTIGRISEINDILIMMDSENKQ
jgi:uncharacterized coiled-coil DUF342 family protein